MKKILIYVAATLVVLIIATAAWLMYAMGQPLYEPGMVRAQVGLRGPLEPPAQGREPGVWHVGNDVRLHWFAEGTGPPVLVVHGGPGRPIGGALAALAPLTTKRRFVYYDQRGCGGSTRPADRFASANFGANVSELDAVLGLGAQIADIERIRRLLGEEKLVLLGHSFGGFLATLYAAEFPEHVERMVLVAPADLLLLPVEGGDMFQVIGQRLPDERKFPFDDFLDDYMDFSSLFAKDEATLRDLNGKMADWYLEAGGRAEVPEAALGDPAAGGGWSVQAAYFSMGRAHDYREALRAIQAPVLVLHGSADLMPVRGSRNYLDALPNAALEVLEGAGHFLLFEENPAATKVIGNFLGVTVGR